MQLKLTPIALMCSALFVSGCSWDGDNDPSPEPVPENQAPIAGDQGGLIVEAGASIDIDLSNYASDPDGDDLTYTIVQQPAYGVLTDNGAGKFTYAADADEDRADSFIYKVSDGEYDDEGEISITITPEDNNPIVDVTALNQAIMDAAAGDTIVLAPTGVFSSGVITVDKPITIDGGDVAVITGSTCFQIKAGGAKIQNLTLKNDFIGLTEEQDANKDYTNTCAISNSDGQTGAITIVPSLDSEAADYADQLAALQPVVLENVTFDATNNTEQANYGNTKASWVTAFSLFEMNNSSFVGLSANVQNNGVFVNCSRSDESRQGSKFINNNFAIGTDGTKETAAIKVGDSSGGVIKGEADSANATCNLTLEGNNFDNYKQLQNQNAKNGDGNDTPVAIHSWVSALNDDYAAKNSLDGEPGSSEPVDPVDPDPVEPEPVEGIDTVAKLNDAIAAATEGDVIELAADGVFDSGVIALNKAVTIDGLDEATISGSACIKVEAAGAVIQNLGFANTLVGIPASDDFAGNCGFTNSVGQTGAITIVENLSGDAVEMINLTIDAAGLDTQDKFGAKKASLIAAHSQFKLVNSTFTNMPQALETNGLFVRCSKSAVHGSEISGNEFTVVGDSNKENAAIKLGDSSSKLIKEANANCDIKVTGNTFTNYVTMQIDDQNDTSVRPVAMYARTDAFTNDTYLTDNTLVAPAN